MAVIADSALRRVIGAFAPGEALAPVSGFNFSHVTLHGEPLFDLRDLAQHVLDLRVAAHEAVDAGTCANPDCCATAMKHEAARQRLRALLPEPERDGGTGA